MSQADTSLVHLLNTLATKQALTDIEWQQLAAKALKSSQWSKIFGLTPGNVEELIRARYPCERATLSQLLQTIYTEILSLPSFEKTKPISREAQEILQSQIDSSLSLFKPGNSSRSHILLSVWNLWLPFALQLAISRQKLERPFIQGILGGQGTGKTTLAAVLRWILAHFGYRILSLSLDDLYKTYAERQRLQEKDPRLIWRGPPGTHDVALGIDLLDQLRQPNSDQEVVVPRFDKSAWGGAGDRTAPERVEDIDIVLFEGWFVGVRPIQPAIFDTLTLAPIDTIADRVFARDMNEQLKDYLPLWERLDRLMLLYPTDYRLSQQWRRQAEQEMIATGKSGMTNLQVDQFVEYFWKALHPELFITPLTKSPSYVDLVVEINPDHSLLFLR